MTGTEVSTTYATGRTIKGQHCGNCGRPDFTQNVIHYTDSGMWMEEFMATPCCNCSPCFGYVTTSAWVGLQTNRETWACCRGGAERTLGEPAKLLLKGD